MQHRIESPAQPLNILYRQLLQDCGSRAGALVDNTVDCDYHEAHE
jgi:hypothetical protein